MDPNSKSQVVERLKIAQDVLVTVSSNPSVDQLSAAIGLTLLLNKLGKHATAVFSGEIPSVLEFLKPEDTLETNTDSLRDFIISLDKAKADKLRYKVEENVVKIFITPYKTSLSEQDLNFEQGDFNVDVVMALGVTDQDNIDHAIMSHGRILHDATVIGVMSGSEPIDIGNINWQEPNASSLCEMLVSISESFGSGLLDNQMATAFLTGIVAKTDRFSNDRTTSKVMTMSAQLMAAGANQQLIASELKPANSVTEYDSEVEVYNPEYKEKVEEPAVIPQPKNEATIPLHPKEGYTGPVYHEHRPNHSEDDIHIDEHGTFKDRSELKAESAQYQLKEDLNDQFPEEYETTVESASVISEDQDSNNKTDNDKEIDFAEQTNKEDGIDDASEYSEYMETPPETGATFTASDKDNIEDPAIDPLSILPPIPDGGGVQTEGIIGSGSVADTEEETPEIIKGSAGLNITSKFDPSLYTKPLAEPIDTLSPLGPHVVDNESLAAIERSVNSFEHPTGNGLDADIARQAVEAASSSDNQPPPSVPPPIINNFANTDNTETSHNGPQEAQFPPIFK